MENLRSTKNQLVMSVKQLFHVTRKLIKDQTDISGLTTINYKEPTWRSTNLLCDKAIGITNVKTNVFADSVLCLWSVSDQPVEAWKNKIKWYLENRYLKDLNRIDGEPMEFEWKIFPGFTTLGILEEIRKFMTELQCELESSSKEGSSSCQCTTTLYEENEETQKNVRWILLQLRIMLADSCSDVGHFWELDQRRKFTEIVLINQMETGTRLLNEGCSTLQKAVILYFVPPAPWKEDN